jgi:hypothetical protein
MLYEALFRGLHGAQVRYLIVGAVAVNLHGVPRMTADLDLMVELTDRNLRFASAYARRQDVPAQEYTVPLTSVPDLIALKRTAGREQDRSDIEALTRLSRLDEGDPT